jgi:hypothetical protein
MGLPPTWITRLDEARESARVSASLQDRSLLGAFEIMLAVAHAEPERAVAIAEEIGQLTLAGEALMGTVFALRAALELGRVDALPEFEQTLTERGDTGVWIRAARLHLRGLRHSLAGDSASATSDLRDALALMRGLELPAEIAVVATDLRRIVGPDHPDAAALEAEVRDQVSLTGGVALARRLQRMLDEEGAVAVDRASYAASGPGTRP